MGDVAKEDDTEDTAAPPVQAEPPSLELYPIPDPLVSDSRGFEKSRS